MLGSYFLRRISALQKYTAITSISPEMATITGTATSSLFHVSKNFGA